MIEVENESRIAFALREVEEFMIASRCELDEDGREGEEVDDELDDASDSDTQP